jgi:hypothetical protein
MAAPAVAGVRPVPATLSPATREVITMTSAFDDIPIEHAASAMVSMEPTWVQAQP